MGVISHNLLRFHPHSRERHYAQHGHQGEGILGDTLEFCHTWKEKTSSVQQNTGMSWLWCLKENFNKLLNIAKGTAT